ncbi:MAG: hypothetical protein AB7S38_17175 [Vulcanimicrobiota bacterium]
MKSRRSLLILTVVLLVCVAVGFYLSTASQEPDSDSEFRDALDTSQLALLEAADKVEVFRLEVRITPSWKPATTHQIDGFPIVAGPAPVKLEDVRRLRWLVGEQWHRAPQPSYKPCLFEPGVAFRFTRQNQQMVLLICLHCNDWKFLGPSGEVFRDCDAVRPELVELVKHLYPDDTEIQSLEPEL